MYIFKVFKNLISQIFFYFFIFTFHYNNLYASAWTRDKGKIFALFETLRESDSFGTIFYNKNQNFYRINSYKLYLEYGLTNKLTFGGYLKKYDFSSYLYYQDKQYTKKINNDYYSNIFMIQNIYNKNNNFFSLEYSIFFPLNYSEESEDVNTIETKNAFELSILFGRDGLFDFDIIDLSGSYFIDSSISYKLIKNYDYDRFKFSTSLGTRLNKSSSFLIGYQYEYYLKKDFLNDNKKSNDYYDNYHSNQIKVSFNYKFLDDLSTEFSYYKNFSKYNSNGIIFSFIYCD